MSVEPWPESVPSRRFGRLGWQVRPVGLGGAWLKSKRGADTIEGAAETVLAALDLGIDFIDTSIRYGESELVIGHALRSVPVDQRPRLATKSQVIPADQRADDGVFASCEESLRRLGVDRVDLFQIHESEQYGWDRIMGPQGALEGLRKCQARGLCTGIGVTGRPVDLLTRLVRTGEFDSVLTYYEYDLATAAACRELLPAAQALDVAVIAGSPVRMGMFSRPDDGRWERQGPVMAARRHKLEALLGCPVHEMGDLAVRYLLSDPRVHNLPIGSSRIESLRSSIAAAALGPLEPELVAALRAIGEDGADG